MTFLFVAFLPMTESDVTYNSHALSVCKIVKQENGTTIITIDDKGRWPVSGALRLVNDTVVSVELD